MLQDRTQHMVLKHLVQDMTPYLTAFEYHILQDRTQYLVLQHLLLDRAQYLTKFANHMLHDRTKHGFTTSITGHDTIRNNIICIPHVTELDTIHSATIYITRQDTIHGFTTSITGHDTILNSI